MQLIVFHTCWSWDSSFGSFLLIKRWCKDNRILEHQFLQWKDIMRIWKRSLFCSQGSQNIWMIPDLVLSTRKCLIIYYNHRKFSKFYLISGISNIWIPGLSLPIKAGNQSQIYSPSLDNWRKKKKNSLNICGVTTFRHWATDRTGNKQGEPLGFAQLFSAGSRLFPATVALLSKETEVRFLEGTGGRICRQNPG